MSSRLGSSGRALPLAALLLVASLGCEERRAAEAPATPATTPRAPAPPAPSANVRDADAAGEPLTLTEAGSPAPAGTPAELVWYVTYAGQSDPGGEPRDRWRVALEARAGTDTRRLEIGYATGLLVKDSQRACGSRWPVDKKEKAVARVVFTYAGSIIYAVVRRGPNRYAVVELFDGHLADGSLDKKELQTFELALGDAPAERIVQEKNGSRTVLCP